MLLPKFKLHEPASIEDALKLKKSHGSDARLMAGGTDVLVLLKKKVIFTDTIISLSKIKDLSQITQTDGAVIIGACATMAQLSASPVIQEKFNAIKTACQSLGTHLIRNRATIGGNCCNASPAGDSMPALMIYDAKVIIESAGKKRELPIEDFFKGPGKTDLAPNEILTGFKLPIPPANSGAHYIQLGKRQSSEINVVNVGSFLEFDPDTKKVINTRIALGSVAATPIRAEKAEDSLKGKPAEESSFYDAGEAARKEDCKPIDDFRGSASYRQAMIGVLTKRTLQAAFEQAK
ncbi:MAG: xanthine dehydrogenase family protein subunit M [Desulfobacula sp.]|nr:xanthine dehydrogenase family protein subunit M [Desulfobacula sp.]